MHKETEHGPQRLQLTTYKFTSDTVRGGGLARSRHVEKHPSTGLHQPRLVTLSG